MRIKSFHIENFRNLRLAEAENLPDFIVICGNNGCGKSALLEALIRAKEHIASYGSYNFKAGIVSANSKITTIEMELEYSKKEQSFVEENFNKKCPEIDEIHIEINKAGKSIKTECSESAFQLLKYYSSEPNSPGFFDYIGTYRQNLKGEELKAINASIFNDVITKQSLAIGDQKFYFTKRYLAALKYKYIQNMTYLSNQSPPEDPLEEIRNLFKDFFVPMEFKDVFFDRDPFEFIISTPLGNIDIDELSSGEKEIFNIVVRFHQLKPKNAIILLDEVDSHLHPELQRKYLKLLRKLGKDNQLFLTTHSPEIMMEAGSESLFTILKYPPKNGNNQFVRVSDNNDMHKVLSELMGSRGFVSFNKRIVFIEGRESSADRMLFEKLYPPNLYNISFVSAGNSSIMKKIAEQVNFLLSNPRLFQQYYSIIDGDIERFDAYPSNTKKLFKLPVYHIENFLIDSKIIFELTSEMLGSKCNYRSAEEVEDDLKDLLFAETHVKPYTRALLDSRIAKMAQTAYNYVYKKEVPPPNLFKPQEFFEVEEEAKNILKSAIDDNTWKSKCKGRDLIKAYCKKHNFPYEIFRNLLIEKMENPKDLEEIINRILKD